MMQVYTDTASTVARMLKYSCKQQLCFPTSPLTQGPLDTPSPATKALIPGT